MTVSRFEDTTQPATLSIHFASSNPGSDSTPSHSPAQPSSSPAPSMSTSGDKATSQHEPTERVEAITVNGLEYGEILKRVLQITEGREVEPSAEEREWAEGLRKWREQAAVDKERTDKVEAVRRRDREMLASARGEAQRLREESLPS